MATKKANNPVLRTDTLQSTPAYSQRLMREYTVPGAYYKSDAVLTEAKQVFKFLQPFAEGELTEVFWVLLLDADGHLLTDGPVAVSKGTLTEVSSHPREVFALAMTQHASAMIVAHNHPGDDPTPSANDKRMAEMFVKLGYMHAIPVLDSIIVTRTKFHSMGERNELPRIADGTSLEDLLGGIVVIGGSGKRGGW